jgi:hypothetical protein
VGLFICSFSVVLTKRMNEKREIAKKIQQFAVISFQRSHQRTSQSCAPYCVRSKRSLLKTGTSFTGHFQHSLPPSTNQQTLGGKGAELSTDQKSDNLSSSSHHILPNEERNETYRTKSKSTMLSKDVSNVFRSIAYIRHSCKRFQTDKPIPGHVLKDIIDTSLVRK